MTDADLDRWIAENYPSPALDQLNAMFTKQERDGILDAALLAQDGDHEGAEQARKRAGYGGLA